MITTIIFDLDETLIDDKGIPYEDSEDILQTLSSSGKSLLLASHNYYAKIIVKKLGWDKYFDGLEYPKVSRQRHKLKMFFSLRKKHNFIPSETIYFDDNVLCLHYTRCYYPDMFVHHVYDEGLSWNDIDNYSVVL